MIRVKCYGEITQSKVRIQRKRIIKDKNVRN